MAKLRRPPGLIRYGSRDAFEGKRAGWLRPRVVLYPIALAVSAGLLVWQLGTRSSADVTLLGPHGAPYVVEQDGSVVNQVRVKIANRGVRDHAYAIAIAGAPGARLVAPENPLAVAAGETGQTSVFVISAAGSFTRGERTVTFSVGDGAGFEQAIPYRLVGPQGAGDSAVRAGRRERGRG